jgi:antitoxin HigA-1
MIFNPAHPGEVLKDYLGEMSVKEAASRLGVTRAHLSRILNGHASITARMSLRLSAALGTSPEFWLRMQMQHDLWQAQRTRQPKVRRFPHVGAQQERGTDQASVGSSFRGMSH